MQVVGKCLGLMSITCVEEGTYNHRFSSWSCIVDLLPETSTIITESFIHSNKILGSKLVGATHCQRNRARNRSSVSYKLGTFVFLFSNRKGTEGPGHLQKKAQVLNFPVPTPKIFPPAAAVGRTTTSLVDHLSSPCCLPIGLGTINTNKSTRRTYFSRVTSFLTHLLENYLTLPLLCTKVKWSQTMDGFNAKSRFFLEEYCK